ncbi:hypothetical protein MAV_1564 [Mycobacterium avium 104]|uniref:Uncharacterized protein n=1 Tax=Mycobacterium avium (strain 104) TaxID=243243 RepID=A0A0H2ZUJ7_MYCA1|nr:hypothetical protein MAV_1564 [Mycobacterium avium 104]
MFDAYQSAGFRWRCAGTVSRELADQLAHDVATSLEVRKSP